MTVSIVIPTYNGSRFIEQAILSVLNQERKPDEILVCDDNSTDNTLEICRRYADRLSIFTNPNGPSGFVNAWNKAIAKTTSDYISILHQDDLLAPAFLRVAMDALEKDPGIRHLFTTCRYIDEWGVTTGLSYPVVNSEEIKLKGAEYAQAYQRLGLPHIHRCPGVITHHSIFDDCRYEPAAGHIADDDFFYRVGMFTDVIGILAPLASFREHTASVTGRLEEADLAAQLVEDYLYQCHQWKEHPFINNVTYGYFIQKAGRYIRRCIAYGVRRRQIDRIIKGFRQWRSLIHLKRSGKR